MREAYKYKAAALCRVSLSRTEVFESGFLRIKVAFIFPLESLKHHCLWMVTARFTCCEQA